MEAKNLIWAAVGLVIGAVLGAVATYKHAEHKYEMMLDEEVDNYREYCRKKYEAKTDEKSDPEADSKEDEDSVNIDDIPQSVIDSAAAMRKTAYNKITKKYDTRPERRDIKEPVVIDPDEYENNHAMLEEHLFYDPGRCEAWKDAGETIDDVDATLGFSNLEEFEKRDVDILYIKNEDLNTIFVVEREVNDDPFV